MNKNKKLLLHEKYGRSQYTHIIYTTLALSCVFFFAFWWFHPHHVPQNFHGIYRIFDSILFLLVSYVVWHPLMMEVLTWSISSHIKGVRQQKPVQGLRVAFITTIVPANESIDLLHKCLPAMVKASYEHDTWLLDEGNSPEVKALCLQYGVKHFSRCGRNEYNTPKGKFTKTKGGNHNSWYDVYGNNYDIVAQIDTDFVPKPTFLTKTLGQFRDPNVAFVGTPQIYGNTRDSIIAQGAAEQLYSFYGSILRGLSGMHTTLLIGANHVIRVAALKHVGHYSAHITEDLLTGMKLHTKGWKSVYLSSPLAIGEGPATWESYFSQQMRWAYGCIDILFHHSPNLFRKMGLRRAIYYFFLQQHYFSGIVMAVSIFLLSLYFLLGIRAADVDIMKFFIFYASVQVICWLMSVWLQRYNVYRKREGELFLAGKIISIAAWPIWFLAFVSVLLGKRLKYKVTPKGTDDTQTKTSPLVFVPHVFFGLIPIVGLASVPFTHRQSVVMLFWAVSTSVLLLSVPFIQSIFDKLSNARVRLIDFIHYFLSRQSSIVVQNRLHLLHRWPGFIGSLVYRRDEYVSSRIKDSIFLSLTVIASCVLYIQGIGFYSDDWSFLGNFSLSYDQSLIGLIKTATTPNTLMRPVQNIYDALLYWLFGTQPLGYQIVNTFVLIGIAIVFYLVLRHVKLPRIIAVAAPLVYTLLPQYSADRFWYAAFQANLSMLFYFISLYAGLRALSLHTVKTSTWKMVSIFSLILGALSYEVFLPLVLVSAILFWNPVEKFIKKRIHKRASSQNHLVFIVVTFIALLYIFLYKALTTTRLDTMHYPGYIFYVVSSAFKVNYGTLVLHMPYLLGEILSRYANFMLLTASFILYLVIFWYLYLLISKPKSNFPRASWMGWLTCMSFIIFILGYAIFFTNNQVGFSPTGIENRVAIAAAIGVAFSIIGGIGWLSRLLLPEKLSKVVFCLLIALVCATSFLIVNTLALFWIRASEQGQIMLGDIQQHFPNFPRNSTLLLDGICPYVGPASIFESKWDLKGALQTRYNDASLRADVVTPRLQVKKDGIHTKIYTFSEYYSYRNLFIYNYRNKQIFSVPNVQAANDYFQKFNPDYNNGCPPASAGHGVDVF